MFYNIYFSPTGGTKRVADIISSSLFGEYRNVDLCCEIEAIGFDANDVMRNILKECKKVERDCEIYI